MAAYFNLNNNEISKELLVSKFNMILDNQGRIVQNNQKTASPHNKPHRSPRFVQKQPPVVFCKNIYFEEHLRKAASICFTSKYYSK